jgi:hypothetical protein
MSVAFEAHGDSVPRRGATTTTELYGLVAGASAGGPYVRSLSTVACVAGSRSASLAAQCTYLALTSVIAGTTARSLATRAAALNGERALPPPTEVSTYAWGMAAPGL